MLVLRRRVGETILVGGSVEIEVIEISRSRVKLGVRAPVHVPVLRKETVTVAKENQMALQLVASRGQQGVVELLRMLSQAAKPGSTNGEPGRYELSERYSGYREECENPHPA